MNIKPTKWILVFTIALSAVLIDAKASEDDRWSSETTGMMIPEKVQQVFFETHPNLTIENFNWKHENGVLLIEIESEGSSYIYKESGELLDFVPFAEEDK
jgi:hypothetical protein